MDRGAFAPAEPNRTCSPAGPSWPRLLMWRQGWGAPGLGFGTWDPHIEHWGSRAFLPGLEAMVRSLRRDFAEVFAGSVDMKVPLIMPAIYCVQSREVYGTSTRLCTPQCPQSDSCF